MSCNTLARAFVITKLDGQCEGAIEVLDVILRIELDELDLSHSEQSVNGLWILNQYLRILLAGFVISAG